jgi:hypothetical protein
MARRLTPGSIAKELFGIDPDRDERASQLCVETLLTLAQNHYRAPDDVEQLITPKRERFALRSLALGTNFLEMVEDGRVGDEDTTPQRYGAELAAGADIRGSANLALARDALQGLIDPETHQGQAGGWLLFPFHESLLWYDARRERARPWRVRKVYMRGSGITLARMLLQPNAGEDASRLGTRAVAAIRTTLQGPSPVAHIAEQLESALPERPLPATEPDEKGAWTRGADQNLADLAQRVCRHADGVMLQGTISGPARLWQLRTILALDLAAHALRTAWGTAGTPASERFLLLSFGGPPRAENRIRQRAETAYQQARLRLRLATVATLAQAMERVAREGDVDWDDELENRRDRMRAVIDGLDEARVSADYERLARLATETADYGRSADGFRVLLDTIGVLAGTGAYRFTTATPELLAALVGALSSRMPMTSQDFFDALFDEWGVVIGQDQAARTGLGEQVDGAELERNARRAELLMADAGLALALSDRTVVVGERAKREAA